MHIHPLERLWIRLSAALLIVFAIAVGLSSFAFGIRLPGITQRIAPAASGVPAAAQEAEPWVRELGPGRYEVNLVARVWAFEPREIRVPKGSTVTFYVHSQDVIHGMKIVDTPVSLMVLPGQIGRATHTFHEPGEYLFVCHEYCGMGHHIMHGKIVVTDS